MNFLLGDIVKFIQHKVKRCNKENREPLAPQDDGYHDQDGEDATVGENKAVINVRTPSISAPINRKTAAAASPRATAEHASSTRPSLLPLRVSASNSSTRSRHHTPPTSVNGTTSAATSSDLSDLEDEREKEDDAETIVDETAPSSSDGKASRTSPSPVHQESEKKPSRRISLLPSNISEKPGHVDASSNTTYTGKYRNRSRIQS